jgi:ribosomal protein RSM22 (predicted rRNA methylase)
MDHFFNLNQAIEEELSQLSMKKLSQSAKELQVKYREKRGLLHEYMQTKEEKLAYVGYRMKATLGAIYDVLRRLDSEIDGFKVESVLDLGAGPGTSLWAIPQVFPEIKQCTLVEKDDDLIQIGIRLSARCELLFDSQVTWSNGNFLESIDFPAADLVLLSYSFGEVDENFDDVLVKRCFDAANKYVVIIEPGTPKGYQRILKVRKKFIELGATTLAPCPHDQGCPLNQGDWCHFSTRIERTSIQRLLKEGSLNFEDEKYAFIVMSKHKSPHLTQRVLTKPVVLKEKVTLKLCTEDGIKYQDIPRRDSGSYKIAKKIKWGDNFNIENY